MKPYMVEADVEQEVKDLLAMTALRVQTSGLWSKLNVYRALLDVYVLGHEHGRRAGENFAAHDPQD